MTPTVVCIVGMHRSGTSMIARLLNLWGLDLGRVKALSRDSRAPFENRAFNRINRALLDHLASSWDNPPRPAEGWELDSALEPLRVEARHLIESFSGSAHWGWKDPKTTVLLPFWQRLVPDLRFVVCVRSPLEVAQSLAKRNGFSIGHGAHLWDQYTRAAIRYSEGYPRIFTFYEDFFREPLEEVKRVANFCGLEAKAPLPDIQETIRSEMRHHKSETSELLSDNEVLREYKLLYLGLRTLAVRGFAGGESDGGREAAVSEIISRFFAMVETFREEQTVARLLSHLAEREQQVRKLQAEVQTVRACGEKQRPLSAKLVADFGKILDRWVRSGS